MLALGEGKQFAIIPTLFAPEGHLHRRGHDVLIGNAHEGTELAIFELGTHGTLLRTLDLGNHHTTSLDTVNGHVTRNGWHAIHRGRRLDHVDFFIATHTRYLAIILDTDEQAPSVGIGKRREGARNLACIGDFVFEILLLVFALGDEMV